MSNSAQQSNPNSWAAPEWHEDFGDPTAEFELLRSVSIEILRQLPNLQLHLDCFEEGYMTVEVADKDITIAELQIVDRDSHLEFAVFTELLAEEDETYFDDVSQVVSYIARLVSQR